MQKLIKEIIFKLFGFTPDSVAKAALRLMEKN